MHKLQHFCQKMRIGDVLLIQIFSFCAIIYSNTNVLQFFCENSSLNSAKFHRQGNFSCYFLTILPKPKNILDKCHLHACITYFPSLLFLVFVTFALSKSCVTRLSNHFWLKLAIQHLTSSLLAKQKGYGKIKFVHLTDLVK